jgi:hypothetical protein
MTDPRKSRENRRDTYTALVTFTSLVVASVFDFRDDVELLVAFQGALISILHRVRT